MEQLRKLPPEDRHDYVLYVLHDDGPSAQAVDIGGRVPGIWIRFVEEMTTPRPPWLIGVPTLVDQQAALAHRGSAALDLLQTMAPKSVHTLAYDGGNIIDAVAGKPTSEDGPRITATHGDQLLKERGQPL